VIYLEQKFLFDPEEPAGLPTQKKMQGENDHRSKKEGGKFDPSFSSHASSTREGARSSQTSSASAFDLDPSVAASPSSAVAV
jgi:hypothetical protein